MDLNEKIIKSEILFEGSFLKMDRLTVILPDGNEATRDVVRHPGAVAIVAMVDDSNLIIVEQFRAALNKTLLEIPAGKLEKEEDPLECAKRELEEETGYTSENVEYLGKIATGPGFTDEIIYIYKASNLVKGTKGGDEDEFIDIKTVSLENLKKMVRDGEIIDTKTISALAYL